MREATITHIVDQIKQSLFFVRQGYLPKVDLRQWHQAQEKVGFI